MRVFPAPGVAWQKKCDVTVKCSNALVMQLFCQFRSELLIVVQRVF
ncbi:hypothetical protein CSB90_4493 [Pseudomonas aeruginosa]|nr:hypothetical protein CSB90_4493 [Pseudomonas aeruginosa]